MPYKPTLDPDVLHVALITLLGLDNDRRESITHAHTNTFNINFSAIELLVINSIIHLPSY